MLIERAIVSLREIKFVDESSMMFNGHGAVFGNIDAYGDKIRPGAFADFLHEAKNERLPWPKMLSQHGALGLTAEDMTPIGAWRDLSEDGVGLVTEGELADTARGRDMRTLMKMAPRPAIDALSIGYITKESIPRSKPEDPRRELVRLHLVEISPVTFPANAKAKIHAVKSIEGIASIRDAEDYLREAGGLSRTEAKAFLARLPRLGQRDADGGMQDLVDALKRRGAAIAA